MLSCVDAGTEDVDLSKILLPTLVHVHFSMGGQSHYCPFDDDFECVYAFIVFMESKCTLLEFVQQCGLSTVSPQTQNEWFEWVKRKSELKEPMNSSLGGCASLWGHTLDAYFASDVLRRCVFMFIILLCAHTNTHVHLTFDRHHVAVNVLKSCKPSQRLNPCFRSVLKIMACGRTVWQMAQVINNERLQALRLSLFMYSIAILSQTMTVKMGKRLIETSRPTIPRYLERRLQPSTYPIAKTSFGVI